MSQSDSQNSTTTTWNFSNYENTERQLKDMKELEARFQKTLEKAIQHSELKSAMNFAKIEGIISALSAKIPCAANSDCAAAPTVLPDYPAGDDSSGPGGDLGGDTAADLDDAEMPTPLNQLQINVQQHDEDIINLANMISNLEDRLNNYEVSCDKGSSQSGIKSKSESEQHGELKKELDKFKDDCKKRLDDLGLYLQNTTDQLQKLRKQEVADMQKHLSEFLDTQLQVRLENMTRTQNDNSSLFLPQGPPSFLASRQNSSHKGPTEGGLFSNKLSNSMQTTNDALAGTPASTPDALAGTPASTPADSTKTPDSTFWGYVRAPFRRQETQSRLPSFRPNVTQSRREGRELADKVMQGTDTSTIESLPEPSQIRQSLRDKKLVSRLNPRGNGQKAAEKTQYLQ